MLAKAVLKEPERLTCLQHSSFVLCRLADLLLSKIWTLQVPITTWHNEPFVFYVLLEAGPRIALDTLCFWLFMYQYSSSMHVTGICMVKFPQLTWSVILEAASFLS